MRGEESVAFGQDGMNVSGTCFNVSTFDAFRQPPHADAAAGGAGEDDASGDGDGEDVAVVTVEGGEAVVEEGRRGRCVDGRQRPRRARTRWSERDNRSCRRPWRGHLGISFGDHLVVLEHAQGETRRRLHAFSFVVYGGRNSWKGELGVFFKGSEGDVSVRLYAFSFIVYDTGKPSLAMEFHEGEYLFGVGVISYFWYGFIVPGISKLKKLCREGRLVGSRSRAL